MTAMLIIHQPGKAPRIGYPIGYLADSIREWKKHYPDASIYVLQSPDVPPPGTAVVVTAEECLAINDAISAAASPRDRVLRQEVGDAARNGQRIEAALETALSVLEQIATAPRNRGAKRSAAATLAFLRTQLAASQGNGER